MIPLFRSEAALRKQFEGRPLLVTIGNFDGMHRGHDALFREVRRLKGGNTASVLVTFSPHPRFYFAKVRHSEVPNEERLLTALRVKLERAGEAGFDCVLALPFNAGLVGLVAEEFLEEKLFSLGHLAGIIVGEDWCFGRNRGGNAQLLLERGEARNVPVRIICDEKESGERISSSRIRRLIVEGDVRAATALLGAPYRISGRVIHGDRRGRTIGFRTANVALRNEIVPKYGVYSTSVTVRGEKYRSVTNVGIRPTFAGGKVLVETHILDGFSTEIYGERISVEFLERIREEKRFGSVEELKAQIAADVSARESSSER